MNEEKQQRVLDAIEAIKNGEMVIMIDDEDRENEGDLVFASVHSCPQKVNFLIKEARGVVCVALSSDIAEHLELMPMVANNNSIHETAFTVSVDAKLAKTGVSAQERDMTIKLLASNQSSASDLVRPGHIFPLIAKNGGVLERIGHTEGSIDLCKLAGLYPSCVICEIVNEDGTMARRDDLEIFAQKHSLKTIFVADLIEYRLQMESLIRLGTPSMGEVLGKKCEKIIATDYKDRKHTVFVFGEIALPCLVKFHHIRLDLDLLENKKTYDNMVKSVESIHKEGGIMIFLDPSLQKDITQKNYGIGALILKELGAKSLKLIVQDKKDEFIAMNAFGLKINCEVVL